MIAADSRIKGAKVNVLGLTFKENYSDLRNSKVADVINKLKAYGVEVFVHDPYGDPAEALHEYGVQLLPWTALPQADAIVAAVSHHQFIGLPVADFQQKLIKDGSLIEVKACFAAKAFEGVGIKVWRVSNAIYLIAACAGSASI
jgi:UDP-N-acetyl-D-galactosamine dehydrogenase